MFSIENSKKSKFETYKETLLEHWGVLIFVPAILGGLLQILKLANMDSSFVRFFAVEQVVPDGLLIIFLIFIGFITYKIFNQDRFELKNIKLGWNKKNVLLHLMVFLLQILFFCFLLYLVSLAESTLFSLVFKIILNFLILLNLIYLYISINYLYIFKDKDNFDNIGKDEIRNFLKKILFIKTDVGLRIMTLVIIVIIAYFLMGILNVYKEINRIKGLENEMIFLSKVRGDLNIKGPISIEYFNGKYIFLKIKNNNSKDQFIVLKGEGFVNLLDDK